MLNLSKPPRSYFDAKPYWNHYSLVWRKTRCCKPAVLHVYKCVSVSDFFNPQDPFCVCPAPGRSRSSWLWFFWLAFWAKKANSTLRASRAVPHPSTDRAFRRLTSEFGWDRVYSTKYGRWRKPTASLRLQGALAWLLIGICDYGSNEMAFWRSDFLQKECVRALFTLKCSGIYCGV